MPHFDNRSDTAASRVRALSPVTVDSPPGVAPSPPLHLLAIAVAVRLRFDHGVAGAGALSKGE
jgi:hypothetical protein